MIVWLKFTSHGGSTVSIFVSGENGEAEESNLTMALRSPNSDIDLDYFHEYDSGSNQTATFDTNLSTGTWYSVVLTRDTTATDYDLYVDTNSPLNSSYTNNPTSGSATAHKCNLFRWINDAQYMSGELAQVMATSNLTITANMAAALGRGVNVFALGLTTIKTFLPLYGNDDPEPDFSGNGNTGSISGTVTKSSHPPVEHIENYL